MIEILALINNVTIFLVYVAFIMITADTHIRMYTHMYVRSYRHTHIHTFLSMSIGLIQIVWCIIDDINEIL